jgi:arginase family enzyme
VTFYGSGDFHHVSLALLRRIKSPVNLLVIDNHPDWMRGVPFLHCGTWVNHAARLPQVRRVFHVGGDVDFDNSYRWLAPWRLLKKGTITVLPGIRSFQKGAWSFIPHKPVRPAADQPATAGRLQELLWLYRADLARYPLYISLDKDVMKASDAVVNWDSGHLTLAEIRLLLHAFLEKARGNLIAMDIVGDWSVVKIRGLLGRVFHWTMHPALQINADQAALRNEQTNLALLETIEACWGRPLGKSA